MKRPLNDNNLLLPGFRETNKQWQSSSSEASSVRCCQRKGPERSKEDFDSGLLGGASSFSPQTGKKFGSASICSLIVGFL